MNVTLLRAATRDDNGVRRWSIPGAPNQARLLPATLSQWKGAASFSWPAQAADGHWLVRGVRLDWHRGIAKAEARKLIEACSK